MWPVLQSFLFLFGMQILYEGFFAVLVSRVLGTYKTLPFIIVTFLDDKY